jgi:hypothetical protein
MKPAERKFWKNLSISLPPVKVDAAGASSAPLGVVVRPVVGHAAPLVAVAPGSSPGNFPYLS